MSMSWTWNWSGTRADSAELPAGQALPSSLLLVTADSRAASCIQVLFTETAPLSTTTQEFVFIFTNAFMEALSPNQFELKGIKDLLACSFHVILMVPY